MRSPFRSEARPELSDVSGARTELVSNLSKLLASQPISRRIENAAHHFPIATYEDPSLGKLNPNLPLRFPAGPANPP